MFLLVTLTLFLSAGLIGSMPGAPGVPENITVTFINPTSVKVSWTTSRETVEKYDVTYKPTDASYRVVAVVAGNSDAVTLSGLKADTQYQVTVAAVWGGKKYRSRPIVFRTLEPPRSSPQQDHMAMFTTEPPAFRPVPSNSVDPIEYPQTSSTTVRGVEIGIVLVVLCVWVAAIALFFNRWGKIRMLLPYQPDYKHDQLKVPGGAASATAAAAGCNHGSGEQVCQQPLSFDKPKVPPARRPRINSAVFMSNSGPGFDSTEFFRRYGSVSRLCRKAKSVDNISLDEKHFGLPMLSISGPSPPEDQQEYEFGGETSSFLHHHHHHHHHHCYEDA